ncbi:alpha/beta hydrolase-fold protein [Flavobacterium sp. SUN046]|uniref:alpha/beta hydrolase-fold protein n=1 Tax=Flavobacterium sp. SUN046 TaxID=3002440 RepID=UPI002DBEC4A4|nr:alpha/beta hydrolase-fold protein [Flavobacterium sp. SUN046]MEC4050274.1 alpha/beta hydrolase-fold protein [Flavobacterium sp. SUN046]
MKKILILLTLSFSVSAFSQIVKDSILSKKIDAYRDLSISLPQSYQKDSKKVYPLLLLLDGDYLFDPFQGALSYGNYWDDLPETIIVGLHQNKNNERYDDCTIDDKTGLPEGKGAKFFEFIGGELLPYLQTKYRIAPFKIIAGHDVTAGFINFFLYKDQPLFNAYISLSPELSADMEVNVASRLSSMKESVFYYLSSADGDIKKMKEPIELLDQNMKTITNPNVSYHYDEIKGASHYSLVLHSVPNSLYQIFATYQPISNIEFQEKIVKLPSGYADYLKNKYEVLEKALGMKMAIRYNDFKAIEAAIGKNKAYNDYEQLAQLANKSYPKAMLGEYYLAKYYEKNGDNKRASKSYQNAFMMEPIGDLTKDLMLEKAEELRGQLKK